MTEDVYDVAVWCHICDEPHLDCELPDMRYECLTCSAPIEYGDECDCEATDHCPGCHLRAVAP